MSHHVLVSLEPVDPRKAMADYRQPIVSVMLRINARLIWDTDHSKGERRVGSPADLEDKKLIADALDHEPETFCTSVTGCTHGPANADPGFRPAPYKPPIRDGLW